MTKTYSVWRGNEVHITMLTMHEAIKYIKRNLMDERPRSVTVAVSTYSMLRANEDMNMVDFLSWLGEIDERV